MVRTLYTDRSPECCQWLRSLTQNKTLPPGEILEADINEITPTQLLEFTQCHFFCGIGGWPLACDMAGIPHDFPIWTASLPCQPFSSAGYQKGFADRRHLWPVFFNLVEQCRPPIIVGEQVVSAAALKWWDQVAGDLEGIGYAVGAIALPASSVGAYHRRDRLYWGAVANAKSVRYERKKETEPQVQKRFKSGDVESSAFGSDSRFMADSHRTNSTSQWEQWSRELGGIEEDSRFTIWDNPEWVKGRDEKYRPLEPGICPVVDGVSKSLGRPAKLRGYGNAIVPQLGAVFLQEFLEVIKNEFR